MGYVKINKQEKITKFIDKLTDKHSWLLVLFTEPSLYLGTLIENTMIFSGILLLFNFGFMRLFPNIKDLTTSIHGFLGVVISLLLIFRTNTAYDRWWEARKILEEVYTNLLIIKAKSCRDELSLNLPEIKEFLDKLKIFLSCAENDSEIRKTCLDFIIGLANNPLYDDVSYKLLHNFNSLERIKNTPIPIAFSLHINSTIYLYLISLSFVLTTTIGLWSIPTIMIMYFIIGGVNLISNEIENPFYGDPNDLPIDDLITDWKQNL